MLAIPAFFGADICGVRLEGRPPRTAVQQALIFSKNESKQFKSPENHGFPGIFYINQFDTVCLILT